MSSEDDVLVLNRILDFANMCYNRNIPVSTDFLDLNKQSVFHINLSKLPPVSYELTGGYNLAERKVVIFLPEKNYFYEPFFKIVKIQSGNKRFAENLTHRDYLGAIMNLGIAREKFGDIIVNNDCAYVFILNKMSDYLVKNLCKIRNTIVKCTICDELDFDVEASFEHIQGTVASIRLDSIIALGFNSSRSHLISYIEDGKVAVNGKVITTNAYNINEGDIISVRGLGKLRFNKVISATRKGRLMVEVDKYV